MESAFSFGLLRPAGFVNFTGRGKTCFLRGGAACFFAGRGGAGRASLMVTHHMMGIKKFCKFRQLTLSLF